MSEQEKKTGTAAPQPDPKAEKAPGKPAEGGQTPETQAGCPAQDLPEPEPQADPAAALQKQLDDAQSQLNETKDQLLRTLAEYDNFRKRTQKERENLYPEAEAGVIVKFLPLLDNFDRALQSPCADPDFLKGMQMIRQSLDEIVRGLGVEPVGTEGEPFDPKLHNAVMHEENAGLGQNVVAQVLQQGWRRGDKVLRYAMVKTAN